MYSGFDRIRRDVKPVESVSVDTVAACAIIYSEIVYINDTFSDESPWH